jgi:disulfide bond formation protein DsbB
MTLAFRGSMTKQPRQLLLAIGILGIGLVAGGLVLARTMNLAACPLCILQRMIYLLISVEVFVSLAIFRTYRSSFFASVLVGVTAAAGLWMAGYQTWLQRVAVNVSCTADQPWWESLVYWAGERVPLLFESTGLCSEAGWKFLSLSIAEWSLLMFAAMVMGAIRAAVLSRR